MWGGGWLHAASDMSGGYHTGHPSCYPLCPEDPKSCTPHANYPGACVQRILGYPAICDIYVVSRGVGRGGALGA